MPPRFQAELFGVSERTLRRWRRSRQLPKHARNMVEVMREQRAPFGRGVHRGPCCVGIYSWRERLYGPDWKSWASPETLAARAARQKQISEAEAALLADVRRRRSHALRQAWQRRRMRFTTTTGGTP